MAKKRPLLGKNLRKVQPKLRMIANGSQDVNETRSDLCSSIRVKKTRRLDTTAPFQDIAQRINEPVPRSTKSLRELAPDIECSVFIQRVGDGSSEAEARPTSGAADKISKDDPRRSRTSTTTMLLSEVGELADDDAVAYIELGEALVAPSPEVNDEKPEAPRASDRNFDRTGGKGVLIGIIDVQGFDFAHRDFLDADGKTRFTYIWDQGGETRDAPPGFDYGAEIPKKRMDDAIAAATGGNLPAHILEPQSQMAAASHGTHVASIAAGNRGVCRKAFLAGVVVSLPSEDADRRRSFYDSTRIAHAVDYLLDVAKRLRDEHGLDRVPPVSINISLGTNGHAHDASSAVSRWVDSALAVPGRSVCVAAGNAGQEAPQHEDDFGYILGRIHTSGRISARGLTENIEWIVAGNGIEDVSENELEIWYSPADRFAISLKPPGMEWTEPIEPGQFVENRQLPDGSFVSVYNELYHPANGANYIAVYLSPFLSNDVIGGVRAGEWQVRLHGREIRDGRYDGWIERDDPRRLGRFGMQQLWRFPSFFSSASNVDDSSVSSLACGHRLISVANLDHAAEAINITSSQGPTRDGRFKPDVAAPGTDISAAKGFATDGEDWVEMTGTSMASPHVCGVIGLMLAHNPELTAAQIGGIIQRTAKPLPGADFNWRNDAGYGAVDATECVQQAGVVNDREDIS